MKMFIKDKAQQCSSPQELADSREKPGEGFVSWLCAVLVKDSRNKCSIELLMLTAPTLSSSHLP